MDHDSKEPQDNAAGAADRGREPLRPARGDDPPQGAGHDAASGAPSEREPDPSGRDDADIDGADLVRELRDNPVLLTQITAHLQENHLHLPLLTPDHDRMVQMRRDTPELYAAYVEAITSQVRADEETRILPYTGPLRTIFRGQVLGLLSVVAVLVFAGYLAYLDHPWTAGMVAGFDIVALAAVFASGDNGKDP